MIRIGSSEGFTIGLLPHIIQEFRQTYHVIRFELTVGSPATVARQVERGDIDLGLAFPTVTTSAVDVVYQSVVKMVIAASIDHPLPSRKEVDLRDISAYPIALPARNTTLWLAFESACLSEGLSIETVLAKNVLAVLISFVPDGQALAPIATLSIGSQLRENSIVVLPLRTKINCDRRMQMRIMRDWHLLKACKYFINRVLGMLPQGSVDDVQDGLDLLALDRTDECLFERLCWSSPSVSCVHTFGLSRAAGERTFDCCSQGCAECAKRAEHRERALLLPALMTGQPH
ncbi:LysR substrate-binding domain-containing protein [Methylobacterium organophilum]|uniref:LysR substrate-binding domain-containing protein n=1 Tax=Methylobacterium organophilum TaxID=410 RepID=UPI0024B5D916|nr:LysR substrate-binding domain-containing protein [Methylobacterium organophilum]